MPSEPGYTWSWLSKENGGWIEKLQNGFIKRDHFEIALSETGAAAEIWDDLLVKGWLAGNESDISGGDAAKKYNSAFVVAKDQRRDESLDTAHKAYIDRIEDILDQSKISPFREEPDFSTAQTLREGWLKLSVNDPTNSIADSTD